MSTHKSRNIAVAKYCNVSDLIFKFNCATYFRGSGNGGENAATALENGRAKSSLGKKQLERVVSGKSYGKSKNTVDREKEEERFCPPCTTVSLAPKPVKIVPEFVRGKSCPTPASAIVLAVDATPTRVGGLLRLPGKERTIFFYGISWANRFEINDSTKFEMVNTALALELFDPYLRAYRNRYEKFIVKTDSNFYDSIKGFTKDPYDLEFLVAVRDKVKSFQGTFQHTLVSQNDPDIQNADFLSRTEIPMSLKMSYDEGDNQGTEDYALVNLSSVAYNHTLDAISEAVPGKYLKGYNFA